MVQVKTKELSEYMIRAGFTGAGLARAAGITQGYMSQILNGRRPVLMPPTAKKICDALECDFDVLFEILSIGDSRLKCSQTPISRVQGGCSRE